jgi:hypothetical protein
MSKAWAGITKSCAALALTACGGSPTAPMPGSLIALASLTSINGGPLPCCAVDSGGARVTIVAGTLRFYRFAHYTDTVPTPAGTMSGACVQEVPDGAFVGRNQLVTAPDGSSYLLLPCSVGEYSVTLMLRIARTGSADTTHVIISRGTYAWKRDALSLTPDAGTWFATAISGATIGLWGANRWYQFLAVPPF